MLLVCGDATLLAAAERVELLAFDESGAPPLATAPRSSGEAAAPLSDGAEREAVAALACAADECFARGDGRCAGASRGLRWAA